LIKSGILIHVNYLQPGWEALAWGEPEKGLMGTIPKVIQLLLVQTPDEPITDIVMYTGPSRKDGLNEGEYSKKYLLDHFNQLNDFPQLKPLIETLSNDQLQELRAQLEENIHTLNELVNSSDEVTNAAKYFAEHGITKIYQVAVASHAPRCIQLQALIRYRHEIPVEQFWYTIAADTTFEGTAPNDVIVAEPPHRGDDPAFGVHPSITDLLKQYYALPYEARQPFLKGVASVLDGLTEYSKD
jgi:hypothetical protein